MAPKRLRSIESSSPIATASHKPAEREPPAVIGQRAGRAPRVKISNDGDIPVVMPDHPNKAIGCALLLQAIGTTDADFLNGFLYQLADAASRGSKSDEQRINFMLSVVESIKPRDHIEAMLAAQMAAVHMATMAVAGQLTNAENIAQQDSAERAFGKLARTFSAQTEALKRYRTGGEQKVTVQHVTVGEGGQAIVGNVTQDTRRPNQTAASPALLPDARIASMPSIKARRQKARVPAPRANKKK